MLQIQKGLQDEHNIVDEQQGPGPPTVMLRLNGWASKGRRNAARAAGSHDVAALMYMFFEQVQPRSESSCRGEPNKGRAAASMRSTPRRKVLPACTKEGWLECVCYGDYEQRSNEGQ